jgi:hypothetical protein
MAVIDSYIRLILIDIQLHLLRISAIEYKCGLSSISRALESLQNFPSLLLNKRSRLLFPKTDSELLSFVHHLIYIKLWLQEVLPCIITILFLR